jgi:hypothetical protein
VDDPHLSTFVGRSLSQEELVNQMEEARLVYSLIYTFIGACVMFFGRYLYLDAQAKAYCRCGHEYNEHNIVPKGRGYVPIESTHSNEACKLCVCKKYRLNERDKRNTPPVKFFPR